MNIDTKINQINVIQNKKQLEDFQVESLKNLLLHSYENVPYYHKIFNKIGIIENEFVDLNKFNDIPILTKDIIRKHYNDNELYSNDLSKREGYYNSSGGSTGEPVKFIQDNDYKKMNLFCKKYHIENIIGYDLKGLKKLVLWGSERDIGKKQNFVKRKLIYMLTKTIFLNASKMTDECIRSYINIINSYEPDFIRGYAGALFELSRYAQKNGLAIKSPKVLASESETLTYEMRDVIEKKFGTRVFNCYGSRETGVMARECKKGLMHIYSFFNLIELLNNENKPVKKGEQGRVIVTNLYNYSMPFIRYEIGDTAVLGSEKCDCGSYLPTLLEVTGRMSENFHLEDGSIISGSALTLTFNLKEWVKSFRIIQESYKKIRILVVIENNVDKNDINLIETKIRHLIGNDCEIIWDFVDFIPKTANGKHTYIQSLIK